MKEWKLISYFMRYYNHYGYQDARRNGNSFDFILRKPDGAQMNAEVETKWQNYLLHKHHLNPKYNTVDTLILYNPQTPPDNISNSLPPNILFIDREHFNSVRGQLIPSRLLREQLQHQRSYNKYRIWLRKYNKELKYQRA